MKSVTRNAIPASVLAVGLILCSDPTYALRCGHRIVQNGMNEAEVRAICGEPVSISHLGFVLRAYPFSRRPISSTVEAYHPGIGFHQQLAVTELVYNFGPHKLMRRLRFEGDRLKSIETAGYGYLEKDQ